MKNTFSPLELEALAKFMSDDESRPQLCGVIFTADGIASTDGRRLLFIERKAEGEVLFPSIIPAHFVLELLKDKDFKKMRNTKIVFEVEMSRSNDVEPYRGKVKCWNKETTSVFYKSPDPKIVIPKGLTHVKEKPVNSSALCQAQYILEGAEAVALLSGKKPREVANLSLRLKQYKSQGPHGPCFHAGNGFTLVIMPLKVQEDEPADEGEEKTLEAITGSLSRIVAFHDRYAENGEFTDMDEMALEAELTLARELLTRIKSNEFKPADGGKK